MLWNTLDSIRRRENARRGYLEVRTPLIYDEETFLTSGHIPKYQELMFMVETDSGRMGVKAMNCPGHMLLFGERLRSYRELPVRYAEAAPLHRNELAGTLHGILRARNFVQDDAHVFCAEDQIQDEIHGMIEYVGFLYGLFGMSARAEFATRPENKLGDDDAWDRAEAALQLALERNEIPFTVAAGEGAFYGPKIDLFMDDALGRSWQMGTIQIDYQMPERFGLTYMGADNVEHTPVVVHRALFGSFERFLGIVIENFGGAFPFWLAPVQARLIPVGEDHRDAVAELCARLEAEGFRVDVDRRDETLGKRIRDAELEKIPFTIVYGDRESDESLAVRERGGGQSTMSVRGAARTVPRRACYALALKEGADHCPSPSRAHRVFVRVQPSRLEEEMWPLLAAVFVVHEEDSTSLVKSL